jgi:hypothetical protein
MVMAAGLLVWGKVSGGELDRGREPRCRASSEVIVLPAILFG